MNNNPKHTILDLSALELLPQILEELSLLRETLTFTNPKLTNLKDVQLYLEIKSKTTIYRYIESGTFKEGVHYEKVNDKILYIPKGIIQFKKDGLVGKRKVKKDENLDEIINRMSA